MQIRLEPGGGAPLYRQLADALLAAITGGQIARGEKLPTVRALSDELRVSPGTVKRAYEELAARGAVRMAQGSGTFACWQAQSAVSRKEQATTAIDAMLDTLEELNFSAREISVFLDLKLRERLERGYGVRLALVDCNPEALGMFVEQLSELEGVDILPCLLSEARESPVVAEAELIATTEAHFAALSAALPGREDAMLRLVVAPTRRTVMDLARLPRGTRVGAAAVSRRFADIMAADCARYVSGGETARTHLLGEAEPLAAFLSGLDALVLPEGYRRLTGAAQLSELAAFARNHALVTYEYRVDRGSCLYLRERVTRLQEDRRRELF